MASERTCTVSIARWVNQGLWQECGFTLSGACAVCSLARDTPCPMTTPEPHTIHNLRCPDAHAYIATCPVHGAQP